MEQVIKKDLADNKPPEVMTKKGKRGRPSGSLNPNREDVELSPYLQFVQATLRSLLNIIGSVHPETLPKLKLWTPRCPLFGIQSFSFGNIFGVSGWRLGSDISFVYSLTYISGY